MDIQRIIPNISTQRMDESKRFYESFLGLRVVMDMQWIITFASQSNPTAQLSIVASEQKLVTKELITISMEVSDVDALYAKALELGYKITYPLTNEPWGNVRRFWVKDPNGVTINLMSHI